MADLPSDSEALDVLTRRLDVMERLSGGAAHKRDLVDELDQSRRTISRALNELEEADLVARTDDGFRATVPGRFALERLGAFQREFDDIVDARAVVAGLPSDSPLSSAALTGSEAMLVRDPVPHRPLERFHDDLAAATEYRALLPALDDPRHVRLLYEHVVTDGHPAELVVDEGLLGALRTEFPRRTAAMAESDGFEVLTGPVPPFALALVDADGATTVYVVVFNDDGGGVHGVLVNETPSAVRWAEELYGSVRSDAEGATGALLPDADGGTQAVDGGLSRAAIGESLSVTLEREGFVGLDRSYFREEPVADPTTAWRAGLRLPEVHTGYAAERTLDDGDRPLTAALVDELAGGGDCVVVGPPGSGKSTVCKQVACEWYEADRGTVLYREGGRGRPFESVEDLLVTVDAADGHALVVVEDAVRPDAEAAFDAAARLADREDASVLLDAREGEWRDPPGDLRDVPGLSVFHVPPLSDADAGRLVERFERTVDESVDVSLERLLEEVRAAAGEDAAPGEAVLLLHRLATYADPLADERTSIEAAAAAVHDDLAGDDLALDVCTLANALNAAGVELAPGLLYAVADPGEFDAVDAALERLEGRVLFAGGDGPYRAVHETWSVAFLAHLLDAGDEGVAAERFGAAVSALLSLADNPARREAVADHRGEPGTLAAVAASPGEWADETAEAVYALGREHPKLAALFGDGETDTVALPAACGERTATERPAWLGWTFTAAGHYDRAERAFERLPEDDRAVERHLGLAAVADKRGEHADAVTHAEACLDLLDGDDRPVDRARAERRLGGALTGLGDYEAAGEHYRAALDGFEAAGDRRRLARTLNDVGIAAYRQQAYDRARDRFEQALEIQRELGDRHGEAGTLNDLALALREQGEYERAREYQERSLALYRELGDRHGEAKALGNLGILFDIQGDHERAREQFERSLEMKQEVGARRGVANSHGNLGRVAESLGEYDRAREHLEQALSISRDTGRRHTEALTLRNLGRLAAFQGDYEAAREYQDEAMATSDDIGDRHGVAGANRFLGFVALALGREERARERFREALSIAEDIDHLREATTTLRGLGELARRRGEFERAAEHLEAALDRVADVDDPAIRGRIQLSRARLALARGDHEAARERATASREALLEETPTVWTSRCRRLLGRVAAVDGDEETAREHWRTAVEAAEAVGAPQEALATLEHLVATCRSAGDEAAARRWVQRAEATLAEASGPVADQHREWVDRQADALDAGGREGG